MRGKQEDSRLSRTLASTQTLELAGLHTADIFYTPIEERFERISRLALRALDVPVAATTLLHPEKQWFKSVIGWDVTELSLSNSFCARIASECRVNIVADTLRDARFVDHPLVVGHPKFRFYASYPLYENRVALIGTFCVFDTVPREFTEADCGVFADLGELVQRELLAESLTDAQSELIGKLGSARREAMFDPLTRVWNRRGAKALLESSIKKAKQQRQEVGICLLDLDNFKRVNDGYGHQTGDHVLRKAATALVNCLRPGDIVCRYGGDEFLIILPGAGDIQTATIAERARRSIADSPIRTRDGELSMSISAGYAVFDQCQEADLTALVSRVDAALMECKRAGRNQIRRAG